MNCQEIKTLMVPFLDSDLPEEQMAMIRVHLGTCKECQKEKMLHEKSWSLVGGLKAPKISPLFKDKVMARVRQLPDEDQQVAFGSLGVAFISLIVLALVYVFVLNRPLQVEPKPQVTIPQPQQAVPAVTPAPAAVSKENTQAPVDRPQVSIQLAARKPVSDDDIVRNLGAFSNPEFYQNLPVLNDYDVASNLSSKESVL